MTLNKQQRIELNDLLLQLFNYSELTRLVRLRLDEDLSTIASHHGNLTDTVRELVDWMERRSREQELVVAALIERPNLAALAALSEQIGQSASADAEALPGRPAPGSVVVDIDGSNIQGSSFSINIGGGGRTPSDTPYSANDLSSTDAKRQALQERLQLLLEKLSAANRQYDQTLSEVEKVTLKRVIAQLEEELGDVEQALAALDS